MSITCERYRKRTIRLTSSERAENAGLLGGKCTVAGGVDYRAGEVVQSGVRGKNGGNAYLG